MEQNNINIEWQDKYTHANYTECSITIDIPCEYRMTLIVKVHFNDGRTSIQQPVIDARGESRTFYQRAEELVKKKYPGAVYAYIIPTKEEHEYTNYEFLNQIMVWEKN